MIIDVYIFWMALSASIGNSAAAHLLDFNGQSIGRYYSNGIGKSNKPHFLGLVFQSIDWNHSIDIKKSGANSYIDSGW